ncbi:ABC transporter substrate-binding protein [Amycolatopsis ultiminotia]|uniref:ABC transporter substrate-binding protein n=1 Tax=Amycolatopsis ultiminotia TaxID=543629 RepID=A0ABP6W8N1_9PSEU
MSFRFRSVTFAVAVSCSLGLLACAPVDEGSTAGAPPSGSLTAGQGSCAPAGLKTLKPGSFTFGTDEPVYQPWFSGNQPANGKGFESAVAYAVAGALGYQRDQVSWVRVPFSAAIQPGAKTYDADLNEFSITDERRKAVDFSAPYYEVAQAVVATKSSPVAAATTLAQLRGAKLGAQVGTTSYDATRQTIDPTEQISVYNNNDDAKQALATGQIQALVVDLPTAFEITGAAQVPDSVIVGQLPASGKPEQFGAVLDKDSPLTACVSAAVQKLRGDGTLAKLTDEWLARAGRAPELK